MTEPRIHDPNLLHGYDLAEINAMARQAAGTARLYLAADFADRRDAAWHAICEAMLTAEAPPSRRDLIFAGQDAANTYARQEMRHAGYARRPNAATGGPGGGPAFAAYWLGPQHSPFPHPEESAVDRVAFAQVWPQLPERERQALSALAEWGTPAAAARAMGVSVYALHDLLKHGRARFTALWHEGEVPPRRWRRSGPQPGSRPEAPCGTPSAYYRHRRRREDCPQCRAAVAAYARARQAKGKAAA